MSEEIKKNRTKIGFIPTEEQRKMVKGLSSVGMSQQDICLMVHDRRGRPIAKGTLEKHFRKELDEARIISSMRVAKSLYEKATGDGPTAVTAAIFWLKTRCGWKEPPAEVDLNHGGRIVFRTIEPKKGDRAGMTDEENV